MFHQKSVKYDSYYMTYVLCCGLVGIPAEGLYLEHWRNDRFSIDFVCTHTFSGQDVSGNIPDLQRDDF